jgi:hypothetical protein
LPKTEEELTTGGDACPAAVLKKRAAGVRSNGRGEQVDFYIL